MLVAILNAVGWDELLVIRGDVFLTESASAADVGEAIQSAQAKLDDLELDEKVELMLEAVESPANDSIRLGPSLDFPTADETVGADACCSCEGEAAAPCYCSAYLEFCALQTHGAAHCLHCTRLCLAALPGCCCALPAAATLSC